MAEGVDLLIDRYLHHERRDRPHLGFPQQAAGTTLYRSSRQYQDANETLDEASQSADMRAMTGAWDSLDRDEDRALRIDAMNRELGATVYRMPGHTALATADAIDEAKRRLVRLLADRGVFV